MEFRLIGDGRLFDETVEAVRKFNNVIIEKNFLTQSGIAELHKDYGVFLCPSRMDTQGVSRDEAMSSGLVPVTSRVGAIPEFLDDACGVLADGDDYHGLAQGIKNLVLNESTFAEKSRSAASRARQQVGQDHIVESEVSLFSV